MSDHPINVQNPEEEEGINLYEIFFKYLIYWPWFVASVLVCLIGSYVYLRYQTPVYNISSSVLIKEQDKRGGGMSSPLGAIQELGMMSLTNNFDNEIEILKSKTLVKKVVSDLGLYIDTYEDRTFGYALPLYGNQPIKIYMTPEEAEKLQGVVKIQMKYDGNQKLTVHLDYVYNQEKKSLETTFDKLPAAQRYQTPTQCRD